MTALCNQPEAFASDFGDVQSRYLLYSTVTHFKMYLQFILCMHLCSLEVEVGKVDQITRRCSWGSIIREPLRVKVKVFKTCSRGNWRCRIGWWREWAKDFIYIYSSCSSSVWCIITQLSSIFILWSWLLFLVAFSTLISFSQSLSLHLSITQVCLLEFDHSVFGSHWRW